MMRAASALFPVSTLADAMTDLRDRQLRRDVSPGAARGAAGPR